MAAAAMSSASDMSVATSSSANFIATLDSEEGWGWNPDERIKGFAGDATFLKFSQMGVSLGQKEYYRIKVYNGPATYKNYYIKTRQEPLQEILFFAKRQHHHSSLCTNVSLTKSSDSGDWMLRVFPVYSSSGVECKRAIIKEHIALGLNNMTMLRFIRKSDGKIDIIYARDSKLLCVIDFTDMSANLTSHYTKQQTSVMITCIASAFLLTYHNTQSGLKFKPGSFPPALTGRAITRLNEICRRNETNCLFLTPIYRANTDTLIYQLKTHLKNKIFDIYVKGYADLNCIEIIGSEVENNIFVAEVFRLEQANGFNKFSIILNRTQRSGYLVLCDKLKQLNYVSCNNDAITSIDLALHPTPTLKLYDKLSLHLALVLEIGGNEIKIQKSRKSEQLEPDQLAAAICAGIINRLRFQPRWDNQLLPAIRTERSRAR